MNFIGKDNLVSIIVPLYNAEDTIAVSLKSVLEQTYTNWEVIIINDGSLDNSKSIVEHFVDSQTDDVKAKFSLIDQLNAGPSVARNRAVNLAKGDFIAFLDSDDAWISSKLEKQIDYSLKYPSVGIIGGAFYQEVVSSLEKFKFITFNQLLYKNYFATPVVFIKKKYLLELDYLFDSEKSYSEDYDLWLRLLYKRDAIFINETLARNICGKANFGQSGLSSHLLRMQHGEINTYKSLYKVKAINFATLIKVFLFSYLKFFRRLCIVYLKIK